MFRNFWSYIKSIGCALQSPLLLLIRLYWGYQFVITGFGKLLHLEGIAAYFQSLGIPFPHFSALLTGCIEGSCGLLLFLGLFSRLAVIPLFCVMAVAYLTAEFNSLVILFKNFDPSSFFSRTPFLFTYAVILVFCFGPGKISLDYWVTGANKNKEMP